LSSKERWKSPAIQRSFFDRFARFKYFSPLDTEKWYSVTYKEIRRAGGRALLKYYNGSHIKAMVKLYPELTLEKGNFFRSERAWKARKFFEEFAIHSNFNPLDAERWGSVTCRDIIQAGGEKLLLNYNGSHIKALMKLYPELRLKKDNFEKWKVPANQRRFFDGFARFKHFDPLNTEKWYSVTNKEIIRAGGSGLLNQYNGSHIKALVKVYPVLKKGSFSKSERVRKARNFFDEFAKSNNFNPLDTERWYSVTRKEVLRAVSY